MTKAREDLIDAKVRQREEAGRKKGFNLHRIVQKNVACGPY